MSTIVFEGNTYTFGATISTNPGTGTTSYVFGGLNSGSTYGFIIWASGKVGPPPVDTLDFSPNDLMHLSSIRYWPFVFDENTMIQMAGSNIDRSVGWYGIWDDVGPYYNRG